MDVDLVRSIVRLEQGSSLADTESWRLLAQVEHQMLTHPGMAGHHYGLFGGSANSGASQLRDILAGSRTRDQTTGLRRSCSHWSMSPTQRAEPEHCGLGRHADAHDDPLRDRVSADELLDWDPSSPEAGRPEWTRGRTTLRPSPPWSMPPPLLWRAGTSRGVRDTATTGAGHRLLSPLSAIQGLDLRTPIMGMLPADSRASPGRRLTWRW